MPTGMPRPLPDHDTKPFWEACVEGRLIVPRCRRCGHLRWPPGPMCPACQSTATEWVACSGRGSVYSWVVATHPVDAVLADQVPYVIAMIDLPEGARIVGNVEGCRPQDVTAGMEVELLFSEPGEDGIAIPSFRARDQATTER